MTTHRKHRGPSFKDYATPLALRLRELGFVVIDECSTPTLEGLGQVHLHWNDACVTAYCVPCSKPLCALYEVVEAESESEDDDDDEDDVELYELCLVCPYCGKVYSHQLKTEDTGVLCYLAIEGENLIAALAVFDGVAVEERKRVAIGRALDTLEVALKRQLHAVSLLRAGLARSKILSKTAKRKTVRGASKEGGNVRVLQLVVDPPAEPDEPDPDPGPPDAA